MKILDAKGLKCPMPLIETKKALKEMDGDESLRILIDNETSVKNVEHFLNDNGLESSRSQKNGVYEIVVNKQESNLENVQPEAYCAPGKEKSTSYVVMFAKDRLGEGSDELGNALVGAMLNSLKAQDTLPEKIIFMNSGINLVTNGSLFIDQIKQMEENGVGVITCGTCLDYFGKMENLAAGRVSNMHEILESMVGVEKVINI
jgi:selenium metabolism protein YedF